MANHTYSKGLLYKKTLNSSGEVTGSVPLLLKTLGSLVIMSDGTDAETAISTAISNMVTPDETTIVTGLDGITISVKKSTSAEIDEILGDVPTSHTWEGYYTKSETEALIDVVDDKISQSGIETALGYTPIPTTAKGSNNGVAELDSAGKVPASQLPSYVDDVIESATYAALPETGETGKIYVTLNDDKTYRWSGSAYVEISASLALGETSSTAYRGDRGKTAYDHSQATHARTDATNAAIVSGKLSINGTATNIGDFKAVSTVASQGLTDTEKGNALTNIGAVPKSDLVEVVDNGAKNLLDMTQYTLSTDNANGITYTIQSDGTVTAKGTASSSADSYCSVLISSALATVSFAQYCDGNHVLSGCPSGGGDTTYRLYMAAGNYYKVDTGDGVLLTETTEDRMSLVFRVYKGKTVDITFKPMICTKAQFGISSAYEPYALGNQVITPALIEQVDSGAKNIFNIFAGTESCDATITRTLHSDGHLTVSNSGENTGGIAGLSYTVYLEAGKYILSGCPSGGSDDAYSLAVRYTNSTPIPYAIDYGSGSGVFNIAASGTYMVLIRVAKEYAFSNKLFYPMICSVPDWNVSHKFVPYRPNLDLVASRLPNPMKAGTWVTSYTVPISDYGRLHRITIVGGNPGKIGEWIIMNNIISEIAHHDSVSYVVNANTNIVFSMSVTCLVYDEIIDFV